MRNVKISIARSSNTIEYRGSFNSLHLSYDVVNIFVEGKLGEASPLVNVNLVLSFPLQSCSYGILEIMRDKMNWTVLASW